MIEKGSMTVHTHNIFPVIKKWLYSDKDIFLRELVSNGVDAIQKLKRLVTLGEANIDVSSDFNVKVILDKENKTIRVIDNGIGMTAEEVRKYINQVAFSGAEEFLSKYMDPKDEGKGIIGHFGLGFYSAFMVSENVEINTLSHINGSRAVRWSCSGGTEYEMTESDKMERGTEITLSIAQDSEEFLDFFKLSEILRKYCYFLPVDIYIADSQKDKKDEEIKPINDKNPLWLKKAQDITNEEYKEFYREVFSDYSEPLFWIHLNVDYPFNLKGILYFPKIRHEFDSNEGRVKLYCNQVFVADNIKEVIPEFLLLLKGTIDCPDLPLNVSRSFLQNDGYVAKISNHISKKVSDKLLEIFKNNIEEYNKYWDDLNPFIKYGCLRDDKFYDRVKDIIVFKTLENEYLTIQSFTQKYGDKVFYVSDEKQQAHYMNIFKRNNMGAVILNSVIDRHFIQFLEFKNKDLKFSRIDADLSEVFRSNAEADHIETKWLEDLFKEIVNNDKVAIKTERLIAAEIPAMLLVSEQARRMKEFGLQFGMQSDDTDFDLDKTLVVNMENDIIKMLLKLSPEDVIKSEVKDACDLVYKIALLGYGRLGPDEMTKFLQVISRIAATTIK